jgi:hypothetical protein
MSSRGEIHLNLGLRDKATRALLSVSELSGLTVISTRTRDKIVESAPWLRPLFMIKERVSCRNGQVSSGADEYLSYSNPVLADLRQRYSGHPATDHVQWRTSDVEAHVSLQAFRADNLYVFQSRRYPSWVFYASAAYAKEIDRLGLWNRLDEDDRWGAETFDFHSKTVSRDLLDSIIEINFLDRHLGLSSTPAVNVLDVGAGYGRLAHRMATAIPSLGRYYCVDAVPESTLISGYYLKSRDVAARCMVVPLDELDELRSVKIDLAVNIHSFSECRNSVVGWWVQWLRETQVRWIFIASSPALGLTSHEGRGLRKDFLQLIEKTGFKLAVMENKFESARVLQTCGLYPADYYLFEKT